MTKVGPRSGTNDIFGFVLYKAVNIGSQCTMERHKITALDFWIFRQLAKCAMYINFFSFTIIYSFFSFVHACVRTFTITSFMCLRDAPI